MKIVNWVPTLKAMAKLGHITLHDDTGHKVKHWTGQIITCHYIQDGKREFEYKGKTYGTRYFDGCFSPFVVLLSDYPLKYHKPEDVKNDISFV